MLPKHERGLLPKPPQQNSLPKLSSEDKHLVEAAARLIKENPIKHYTPEEALRIVMARPSKPRERKVRKPVDSTRPRTFSEIWMDVQLERCDRILKGCV